MIFIKESNGSWWELNKDKMEAFSFEGGFHNISDEQLRSSETCECDSWHDLFVLTGWCPLEVNIRWSNVWIAPNGKFFNGDAHDNRAEDILEVIFGEENVDWPGDRLEEMGWIRATTSLMWEVRFEEICEKEVAQGTFDALWDWCQLHNKKFPSTIKIR